MLQVDLTAAARKDFGKGASRRLRRDGRTPAILYGPKAETMALSVETDSFTKSLRKIHDQNAIINLDIADSGSKIKRHVMVKEIQKDPVQDNLVHADFLEISLDRPLTMPVLIKYIGTPKGVDLGGILQISARTVHIKGMPLDLPDYIEADVTFLDLEGTSLTCSQLNIPGNVSMAEDPDMTCARVVWPSASVDKSMIDEEKPAEEAAEGKDGEETSGKSAEHSSQKEET